MEYARLRCTVWLRKRSAQSLTIAIGCRLSTIVACRKKFPSEEPLFRLVAVDLVKTDAAVYHISRYLPLVRKSSAPFSFVLCFTLPYARRILSMVLIFEADEAYGGVGQQRGNSSDDDDSEEDESQLSPFDLCLARCVHLPCNTFMLQLRRTNCAGWGETQVYRTFCFLMSLEFTSEVSIGCDSDMLLRCTSLTLQ